MGLADGWVGLRMGLRMGGWADPGREVVGGAGERLACSGAVGAVRPAGEGVARTELCGL